MLVGGPPGGKGNKGETVSAHLNGATKKSPLLLKFALKLLTCFQSLKKSLLLDFRGREDSKVCRAKREPRVKRGHQGSR